MQEYAKSFIHFVNKSPSPYHAVKESISQLASSGFLHLDERLDFHHTIQPGGKYYINRNDTTLISFSVGKNYV